MYFTPNKISLENYQELPIEQRFEYIMNDSDSTLDENHKFKLFCLLEDNYQEAIDWVMNRKTNKNFSNKK